MLISRDWIRIVLGSLLIVVSSLGLIGCGETGSSGDGPDSGGGSTAGDETTWTATISGAENATVSGGDTAALMEGRGANLVLKSHGAEVPTLVITIGKEPPETGEFSVRRVRFYRTPGDAVTDDLVFAAAQHTGPFTVNVQRHTGEVVEGTFSGPMYDFEKADRQEGKVQVEGSFVAEKISGP